MKNLEKYIKGFENGLYTDAEGKENCFSCNDPFNETVLLQVVNKRKNKKDTIKLYLPTRVHKQCLTEQRLKGKVEEEFFDKGKKLDVRRTRFDWVSLTEWWETEYNLEIFEVGYDALDSDLMWFAVWGEGDQECFASKGDCSMAETNE